MSVGIVVKVSEGLVLATDSAATLYGRIEKPEGVQEGVVKTYYNAKKLLQIGDFPIGVLTWGQAFIGARTLESLVREWEYDNHWQFQGEYYEEANQESFRVYTCAERLRDHLARVFNEEFGHLPEEQRPRLGVVVAGYSEGEFFPEIWRFVLPFDDQVHNQRPDRDGKPDFGASWFGLTEPIVRLHWGRDEAVISIISERFGIPQQDIREALNPLQYQVPFAVMPLQDAIEYAHYMLNVTVGRYRFVVGPELCGGEIEIAAITQRQFKWISRKSWKLE
jgi:hypothetical protein